MIKTIRFAFLPLFAWTAAAAAQTVSEDDLRRHILVLADDAYEGRQPGTAGGERTEAYLIEAFAKAGLLPGTAEGTWRQVVRLTQRNPAGTQVRWSSGGAPIGAAVDEIVLLGQEARVRTEGAPVLFIGIGDAADVDGVDLSGRVLLRLPPSSEGDKPLPAAALLGRGAAAVLTILPEAVPWVQASRSWGLEPVPAPVRSGRAEGIISAAAADRLLRAAGADPAGLRRASARPDFRAAPLKLDASFDVRTEIRSFETANIIGKIPGTTRPEEAVLLLAHWDHLGICRPEGAADRICNGAVDNASGTAILIEAARHLAAGPKPGRSIYFLAATAEEIGLVGARAFAERPPVEPGKILAALNLDTTAIGPRGLPAAMVGRGRYPAIDAVVDRTARALGRQIDTDTEANVMIQRQDGWALAERNIPSIMVTGSVSDMGRLRSYLGGVYHGPDDDIANLKDLGGAVEDATLNIAVIRALADPNLFPTP